MTNQTKNSMLLMLCALIWGTAFVAQSAGSGMGAFSFLAGRSWMAVLVLLPTVKALGFVKYNGMTAEKAIYAWIKSEFLMPKKLVFHSTNVYYELMKPSIEQKQKEDRKSVV